ncbi:MAG: hypothetical protein ACYCW6_20145 [Candidatus Xenobia bacterium]
MSVKRWGLTAAMVGALLLPAAAEQGHRLRTQHEVIWLGSLSTGYVVGTDVSDTEFIQLEYMKQPISHMRIQDAEGNIIWEGTPYIGQQVAFHENTHAKFIVWSGQGNQGTAWTNYKNVTAPADPAVKSFTPERPVLDAMQFKVLNR